MAATVCCPTCWTWSEFKNSTACKRCGTPLILPDGRRVDEITSAQPASAPGAGYAFNAQMASLAAPTSGGINWVAASRWITVAYGALAILGLLAFGLVNQYVYYPAENPATGQIVVQSLNIRPVLLVVAIFVAIIFGIVTWLVGYAFARVIWLVFVALGAFATLSKLSGQPAGVVLGGLLSLGFDASMLFVLVMSLLPPPSPTAVRS